MPYHEAGIWSRLRKIDIPESVSYKARRAQDGEMEVGTGEGQPEHKDSTERMQDLAEEEIGEGESASQRVIGSARPLSFSTFKSKFEPYEEGGMVLKREEFDALQTYECPLCRSVTPYEYEVDEFRSLQQLSEHVKTTHDVTFYSSTTYSCQQVLCGRLIKAAHMWLHKENQTFGKSHNKERKTGVRFGKYTSSHLFMRSSFFFMSSWVSSKVRLCCCINDSSLSNADWSCCAEGC